MNKKNIGKYQLAFSIIALILLIVLILRCITLSNAEIGLIAALLGGFISGGLTLIGVKATLDDQKDEKERNKKHEIENVDRIINLLLINEIKDNMSRLKKNDYLFELEYGNENLRATSAQRELSFNEFEKVKFKLIEVYTDNTRKVMELYEMFRMLNLDNEKNSKLITAFTEVEFNFIKSQYFSGQKLIDSYLKHHS